MRKKPQEIEADDPQDRYHSRDLGAYRDDLL